MDITTKQSRGRVPSLFIIYFFLLVVDEACVCNGLLLLSKRKKNVPNIPSTMSDQKCLQKKVLLSSCNYQLDQLLFLTFFLFLLVAIPAAG